MSLVGRPAENHPQQVGVRGALDKVDDRRTPRELYDPLNQEFGFTLDVAASADNALTEDYYDLDADGLAQPWRGVVWCNPPYSDCRAWVDKAWQEMASGCELIVMLLPANRTEQGWWQDAVEPFRDVAPLEGIGSYGDVWITAGGRSVNVTTRFLRGRLRFDTPDHDYTAQPKGNRPPFGNVLVIFRRAPVYSERLFYHDANPSVWCEVIEEDEDA